MDTLEPSRPAPFRLPQELLDAIIDNCDEKRTIIACSLVCRSLLFASRRHTFSKIRLNPVMFPGFFELLISPVCTIRPFVSQLALYQDAIHNGRNLHISPSNLVSRLSGLPSVRSLHFHRLVHYNTDLDRRLEPALRDNFSRVIDIGFHMGRFQSISEFASVVGAFPKIERLLVNDIMVTREGSLAIQLPPFRNLRTLVLINRDVFVVLQWLLAHEDLPSIATLYIDCHSLEPVHIPACNEFFRRLGTNLEHLHLMNPDRDSDYNVSHNTCLRTIHIQHGYSYTKLPGDGLLSLIASSSQIESVILDVLFVDPADTPWAHLDALFSQPQFTNLRKFAILALKLHNRMIHDQLPNCEARGLLDYCSSRWIYEHFPGAEGLPTRLS